MRWAVMLQLLYVFQQRGQQCENAVNCRTLPLWQGLDQVIAAYLCSYTLADLTREEKPQPKRRRTKT